MRLLTNGQATRALSVFGIGFYPRWLHSPEDRSLVLMGQKVEDLVSLSKSPLWHLYEPLVEAGRIIPMQKWMQNVSFDEVWGRLTPRGIPL